MRAHSEAVFFETERAVTREELARAFDLADGVVYHADGIVTPIDIEDTDDVHVARCAPKLIRFAREAYPDALPDVDRRRSAS